MNKQQKKFSIALGVESSIGHDELNQHFGLKATFFSSADTVLPNGRRRNFGVWSHIREYENRDPNDVFVEYYELIQQVGLPLKSSVKLTFLFTKLAEVSPLTIDMASLSKLLHLSIKVDFDDVLISEDMTDSSNEIQGYRVIVSAEKNDQTKSCLTGPDEIDEVLRTYASQGHQQITVFCFEKWPGLVFDEIDSNSFKDSKITLLHVSSDISRCMADYS